eukprot:TRINITY_DN5362_c0_g1_i1.p1 TRINITY_DN5362_c0_g1~~TRINITY_DN5362_c0_g1_i1.p1  ORF type:complete len:590 (-),score=191.86 TRINITY_DN5362_c0_g1_i1:70-1839(-)
MTDSTSSPTSRLGATSQGKPISIPLSASLSYANATQSTNTPPSLVATSSTVVSSTAPLVSPESVASIPAPSSTSSSSLPTSSVPTSSTTTSTTSTTSPDVEPLKTEATKGRKKGLVFDDDKIIQWEKLDEILKKETLIKSLLGSVVLKPALLVLVCVSISHLFGYLGLSYFWSMLNAVLLLSIMRVAINRIIKERVRKYQNELLSQRKQGYESLEWINKGLSAAFFCYTPMLEALIMGKVRDMLLKHKIEIVSCKFGNKPPRLNKIKGLNTDVRDQIEFDTELDLFSNFRMELTINKGVPIDIVISKIVILNAQIRFCGMMSTEKPFFPWLSISLLEDPDIDVKISGKNTHIDFSEFPILSSILHDTLRKSLIAAMRYPNKLEIDILKIVSGGQQSGAALCAQAEAEAETKSRSFSTLRQQVSRPSPSNCVELESSKKEVNKVQKVFQDMGDAFKKLGNTMFDADSDTDTENESVEQMKARAEKTKFKREKKEKKLQAKTKEREEKEKAKLKEKEEKTESKDKEKEKEREREKSSTPTIFEEDTAAAPPAESSKLKDFFSRKEKKETINLSLPGGEKMKKLLRFSSIHE